MPLGFESKEFLHMDDVRQLLRFVLPEAKDGAVLLDVDLVIRGYGINYDTDSKGKFILTEWKYGGFDLKNGQLMTFRLMHEILRKGDPDSLRYLGFYLINYDHEGGGDENSFYPESVTLTKATKMWEKPKVNIEGHQEILRFFRTLKVPNPDAAAQ